MDLGAHDLAAPDDLSPFECSWLGITAPPSQIRNPRHVGTDRPGRSRLVKPSGRKHPKLLKALDRHELQIIGTPFRLKVFARWQPRTSCPKGTSPRPAPPPVVADVELGLEQSRVRPLIAYGAYTVRRT